MKLFHRTLYFFIIVIILQSSLTIIFIANIIKRSNLIEAKKELETDSENYKDNFNSWKRVIWKTLIENQTDKNLENILNDEDKSTAIKKLNVYIKAAYYNSSISSFALKSKFNQINNIISIKDNQFLLSDFNKINYSNERPYKYDNDDHPYIELKLINDKIYIVGILRIPSKVYSYIDFFVLKMIDDEYYKLLVLNRESKIVFFSDNKNITGNMNGNLLKKSRDYLNSKNIFDEFFNVVVDKASYNIAVQRMGNIDNNGVTENLVMVTAFSNAAHKMRLITINRIVIIVSIISALLSVILSFFLSTNITKPIRKLLSAMDNIKTGNLNIKVKLNVKHEINNLLKGFNDMAYKLYEDKKTMNNFIKEITILKDYNEKIINSLMAGIMIINKDFKIKKVNNFFLECFKLEENDIIEKSIKDFNLDIIDKKVLYNINSIINGKKRFHNEIKRYLNKKIYEIKLYPLFSTNNNKKIKNSCIFIVEDISKKVEFEEKIFQAEKLSTISMLSAGIAHEINNPLSSILTNTQNLIDEENDNKKKTSLKWIEQETRRIARTVQMLLDFSSSVKSNENGTDINEVIPEIINLINYSLKKENKIIINTYLQKGIPPVLISQDEFKQIIINLIKNSIQAIEKNGEIIVKAEYIKGNYVNIYIIDNGIGMKDEIIQYIFDPFYTTKNNHEGTGLGLSVVYGIINKYKGLIKVKSKEGQGTTFKITLPILIIN